MARLIESIEIAVSADTAWAAMRDVGHLERMVPQLIKSCTLDPDGPVRTVVFADGSSLVEPIIANDDERKEIVWTAQGGSWTHHNASSQIAETGPGQCSVTWIADVLPDSEAETVHQIMQAGLAAMKETLEGNSSDA